MSQISQIIAQHYSHNILSRQSICLSSIPSRRKRLLWHTTSTSKLKTTRLIQFYTQASKNTKESTSNRTNNTPLGQISSVNPLMSDYSKLLLTTIAPFAVVLGIAMLIDAAYSGDWSRIGVLTKEQELQLQQGAVPVVFLGHSACAVSAGALSYRRGESTWAMRMIKTLFAGFVGLVEVILLPETKHANSDD